MANPTGVTAGTLITETWGDAVVSRVVGIYASTAAAETDGRTEAGALIALTDGTLWLKVSSTSGNWARIHSMGGYDEPSAVTPSASTWTDFGSVTIVAGTARVMHIIAHSALTVSSTTSANVDSHIRISVNGGTTWAGGPIQTHDGVTNNVNIANAAARTIIPTGNIVVTHRVRSTQANTTFDHGVLTVQVHPNLS